MADILIWGASGGIGSGVARLCKSNGWNVIGAARDESRIPDDVDAKAEFRAEDPYSIQQVAYTAGQASNGLDVVVYAAGTMHASLIEAIDAADWQAVIDANLTGAARCIAASVPLLKEGGHVFVLGAYVDKISLPKFGAYAAAKAGLEPLLTVLGKEHRKIKFTLVRPGAVDTPFWRNVPLSLPKGAATAESVAVAMLAKWESGQGGALDL